MSNGVFNGYLPLVSPAPMIPESQEAGRVE
jgi:hypothetical protein